MLKRILLISLSLLILPQTVHATESRIQVKTTGENVQVNVDSQTNSQNRTVVNTEDSSTISVSQSGGGNNSVKINNINFEIKGTVTSVTDNSFDLSNQTIFMDSSRISGLKGSGVLSVGNEVNAKGTVKNGKLYADEVSGSAAGNQSVNPSPTATPSSTPENSPSSSPDILGVNNMQADVDINHDTFVARIINFCKGILSSFRFGF